MNKCIAFHKGVRFRVFTNTGRTLKKVSMRFVKVTLERGVVRFRCRSSVDEKKKKKQYRNQTESQEISAGRRIRFPRQIRKQYTRPNIAFIVLYRARQ